ncbi:hypothetical protein NQT66_13695 [Cellulophaga baltica]|uniref:hypothetical protein n=1 Tax=Cellulophaga baltica TaxID=76594 RepID=UPI0021480E00|nr:hypothetical protein [Cellulophaga baltica]MCR1025871.1 hypothetical protein [Cellulophaga baltica]
MSTTYDNISIEFKKKELLFPKGYYFKYSSIHKSRKIEAKDISEINLNTIPPSLVYKDQEVIFLKNESTTVLEKFAKENNIPLRNRFDIWEHICRPYLDTAFEETERIAAIKKLSENGISKIELPIIQKKVAKTMFLNCIVWEWVYLGLFDYLDWTFLTKKKYWWAMELALRNFKNTITEDIVPTKE